MMRLRTVVSGSCVALLASTATASAAHAQLFALVMQGALDARSSLIAGGVATPFANPAPFSLRAVFDTRTPNLVAPIGVPGFVAYRPISVEMTFGDRTYQLQPFDTANPLGVSVAIFDNTTPFGPPDPAGRYGVGLIQDPLADGSGFIADFRSADPGFRIGATGVVPTTFTSYAGVGVTSGVCIEGPPNACRRHAVTPIPMTAGGVPLALSLGSYQQTFAPGLPVWSASITAVPEPQTWLLMGTGLLGVGVTAWRRRRGVARSE